jgi:hypothetical protein
MYVVIVDIVAVLLIVGGIALATRRPARPAEGGDDPRTYVRRIAGTMMAAFGLAIGLMVTLFHFQSQG